MNNGRYIVIRFDEDTSEDVAKVAYDIQDMLDLAECYANVIVPLPELVASYLDKELK